MMRDSVKPRKHGPQNAVSPIGNIEQVGSITLSVNIFVVAGEKAAETVQQIVNGLNIGKDKPNRTHGPTLSS